MHLEFPFSALSLGRRASISGCKAFLGTAEQPALTFLAQTQVFCGGFISLPHSCLSAFCSGTFCSPARTGVRLPAGNPRMGHKDSRGWWGQPRDQHTVRSSLLCKSPPRLVISTLATQHFSPPGKEVRGVSGAFFCCCALFQPILLIRNQHLDHPGRSPRGGSIPEHPRVSPRCESPTEHLPGTATSPGARRARADAALARGLPRMGFRGLPSSPAPGAQGWGSAAARGLAAPWSAGFPLLLLTSAEPQPGHLCAQPGPSRTPPNALDFRADKTNLLPPRALPSARQGTTGPRVSVTRCCSAPELQSKAQRGTALPSSSAPPGPSTAWDVTVPIATHSIKTALQK